MTIYAEVLHVPYLHNLACAFPEHTFITTSWSPLRELPTNVTIVNHEAYRGKPVDIVIDSLRTFENFERPCVRKIKLFHMERGFNSHDDEVFIRESLEKANSVVFVSDHKRWTFMEMAAKATVVTIPFGLFEVRIGRPVPGVVGTVYLNMNGQQSKVWRHVLSRFPDAELIGMGNPFPQFEPKTHQEFDERFARMDVFVHTVVGNSVGLSFAEAMMRGIPVVTGMNLDLPKELASGYNCFITRGYGHDCLEEMTDFCQQLIQDRTLRLKMGQAARTTAIRIYGLDKFRKNWNHVFNNELWLIR